MSSLDAFRLKYLSLSSIHIAIIYFFVTKIPEQRHQEEDKIPSRNRRVNLSLNLDVFTVYQHVKTCSCEKDMKSF